MEYNVTKKLLNELNAMIIYTADNGDPIPAEIVPFVHNLEAKLANGNDDVEVTEEELLQLANWHNQMSSIVLPATPNSIFMVQQPAAGLFQFLGPIPLVKQLTFLSVIFLVLTVSLALSSHVNADTINKGIFRSEGHVLLLNLLFLLSCAGLGATFASLHQLFGYINNTTFDPKYNATYWIKIIMGLISGLMMSELIPLNQLAEQGSPIHDMGKPLIALLGGFSADLPYRILSRLLEVIEQLFGKNLSKQPQTKSNMALHNLQGRSKPVAKAAKQEKLSASNSNEEKGKSEAPEATLNDIAEKLTEVVKK